MRRLCSHLSLDLTPLLLLILTCLGFRLLILHFWSFQLFTSDQAVIGLMAKHILEGRPMLYYYGQNFMGSLQAFVAAGYLSALGIKPLSVQLAPLTFYVFFIVTHYFLVKRWFGRKISFFAGLWLCLSLPLLTRLSVGCPETLFFASLILLSADRMRHETASHGWKFLTGFLIGLGLWVNQLLLLSLLPSFLYGLLRTAAWSEIHARFDWKKYWSFNFKFRFFGYALHLGLWGVWSYYFLSSFEGQPWVRHLMQVPLPRLLYPVDPMKQILSLGTFEFVMAILMHLDVKEWIRKKPFPPLFILGWLIGALPDIAGGVMYGCMAAPLGAMEAARSPSVGFFQHWNIFFENLFLQTLGLRELNWESAVGVAMGLSWLIFFYAAIRGFYQSQKPEIRSYFLLKPLVSSKATLLIGLILFPLLVLSMTELRADRYFLPIYIPLSVMIGVGSEVLRQRFPRAIPTCFGLILAIQVLSSLNEIVSRPPKHPGEKAVSEVLQALTQWSVKGGYADYELSYLLTFISGEKRIFSPWYGHDRYPFYTQFVSNQKRVAYLDPDHVRIDKYLQKRTIPGRLIKRLLVSSISILIVEPKSSEVRVSEG